ncbi:g9080 [Coccomyxa viridis]|uniref:G9080 protein n=1 Tax=Coccomyxa viridis TaxID=1274662 RepID=A0ABP1G1Z8_9CHLO
MNSPNIRHARAKTGAAGTHQDTTCLRTLLHQDEIGSWAARKTVYSDLQPSAQRRMHVAHSECPSSVYGFIPDVSTISRKWLIMQTLPWCQVAACRLASRPVVLTFQANFRVEAPERITSPAHQA